MMKKENLIALLFAQNEFSYSRPNVVDACDVKELSVDIDNGLWSYQDWKDVKIGKSRSHYDKNGNIVRYGVIGVYDRTNTEHIYNMVSDAIQLSDLSKLSIEIIRYTS